MIILKITSILALTILGSAAEFKLRRGELKRADNEAEIYQHYLRYRDGVPPNVERFPLHFAAFQKLRLDFVEFNRTVKQDSTPNCKLFLNTFEELYESATRTFAAITDNPLRPFQSHVLQASRLLILLHSASAMQSHIEHDAEAGSNLLDMQSRQQCYMEGREEWKTLTRTLLQAFAQSTIDRIGIIGLYDMQLAERELAKKIRQKERWNNGIKAVSLASALAVGVIIWQSAPVIMPIVLESLPFTAVGTVQFLRIVGGIGEAYLFIYLDQNIFFVEDTLLEDKRHVLSWNDIINSTRDFIHAPLNSPRLYYDMLDQIFAMMSRGVSAQLAPWQDELAEAERRWGSIDQALQRLQKTGAPP